MGLERHRHPLAHRGDDVGAEREVGDELTVHHVPLDEVDTGLLEGDDLVAEAGEVGGQHRRDDLDRSGHRGGNVPGRSIRPVTTLLLRPDRFVAGGDAIARDDTGRVVFVRGAVPGETVEAEVLTAKKDWARAITVAVHRPVAVPRRPSVRLAAGRVRGVRVAAPDPRGPAGGPGRHRHRRAASHRRRRRSRSSNTVAGCQRDGYRTTVRVAADADGIVGFRSESSPRDRRRAGLPRRSPAPRRAAARSCASIRGSSRRCASRGQRASWRPAGTRRSARSTACPPDTATGSSALLDEDVVGRRLQVSMGSFFQSGPAAAELLVDPCAAPRPSSTAADLIVDAYAGVGILAVCATTAPTRIVAVETSRTAVADALRNLHDRQAEVVRGEFGGWHAADDPIDVVVADPARSGLGKPGVHALARTSTPVLVLVSCDAGVAGSRRPAAGRRRVPARALGGRRHLPAHHPRRGGQPVRPIRHRAMIDPVVSDEVAAAIVDGVPIVALESTIFSHLGLPSPANADALERCIAAVRVGGAVPAITAIIDGRPRVGLDASEHGRILGPARKIAERDLAVAVAQSWDVGATTVSGVAVARRDGRRLRLRHRRDRWRAPRCRAHR